VMMRCSSLIRFFKTLRLQLAKTHHQTLLMQVHALSLSLSLFISLVLLSTQLGRPECQTEARGLFTPATASEYLVNCLSTIRIARSA
jgi:hypothetical protein